MQNKSNVMVIMVNTDFVVIMSIPSFNEEEINSFAEQELSDIPTHTLIIFQPDVSSFQNSHLNFSL